MEERADELSNARSRTLQSISYINERNRKRNVERAEEAILEEIRASGGQKTEDPFTRRSTKPRMNTKHRPVDGPSLPGDVFVPPPKPSTGQPVADTSNKSDSKEKPRVAQPKPKTGDLFSAHDFDIKIDLEVPLPSKYILIASHLFIQHLHHFLTAQPVMVTPKPVSNMKEAPRRSLNLEDYKKKRGLI